MKRNRWIIGWVAVLLSVLGMEKGWAIDVDSAEKLRTAIGSGNCTINEGIVYLSKDVEALNTIVVKDGNLILDLNGCNYYNKWGKWFNQYEIDIFDIEGGSLTIKGNGSLYNQGTSSNPTIGVTNGVLNVEATIYSEEHNAITLTGNGTVNVREGAHIYSKQSNKIALRVAAGNVTLTGGKIENQAYCNCPMANSSPWELMCLLKLLPTHCRNWNILQSCLSSKEPHKWNWIFVPTPWKKDIISYWGPTFTFSV